MITLRHATFCFNRDIPRLWFRDRPILTHFLNGINLFLPAFESYMVRRMGGELGQIDDAKLRSEVGGLIGQESNHSRSHHQYNEILRQQSYHFATYLQGTEWFFDCLLPRLPLSLQLAIIAGFEHLTASLSYIALQHNMLADAHPTMKALWEWHGMEELEHKTVAFDVFQAKGGSYWQRVVGGAMGFAIVLCFTLTGMILLAAQDSGFLSFRTLADLNRLFLSEYRLLPRTLQRLIPYFKPGFHPSQCG